MLLLDISESNITLSRDGSVLYSEPGVALAEPRSLSIGSDALSKVKLQPDREQNHFWEQLDQSPVHPTGFAVETQADLIYRQLMDIQEKGQLTPRDEVWVSVPGDFSQPQLALLYGIALQAQISIADFVDRGVASAAGVEETGACTFVDVGLHRTIVTSLDIDESVSKSGVSVVPRCGLMTLLNSCIGYVSNRMLDATRFDPRKFADSEQQVFDQLLTLLDSGEDASVVEVKHGGNTRQVEVSRNDLSGEISRGMSEAVDKVADGSPVLIPGESAKLPGVVEAFSQRGNRVHIRALERITEAISLISPSRSGEDERSLHTTIKHTASRKTPSTDREKKDLEPTHLLHRSIARSIGEYSSYNGKNGTTLDFLCRSNQSVGCELVPASDAAVLVNGNRVSGPSRIRIGDLINASGAEFRAIRVE